MSSDSGPTNCSPCFLQKFKLYETPSNFYMIGRNKSKNVWKVLKIDRLDPSDLNILEDSATYTDTECYDLLKRVDEGNKSMGGLKFITICYGIIGFVKFLGPYYMLIITKRRKIGAICGHTIYGVSKSEMIPVPNSSVRSKLAYSRNENRSFVYSACKCNMYLIHLKGVALRISISIIMVSINLSGHLVWCCEVLVVASSLFGGNP